MVKKYIVDLSEDEVSQLQMLIKKGKHKARTITRTHILLMASEGQTDQAMPTAGYAYADTVRVHISTHIPHFKMPYIMFQIILPKFKEKASINTETYLA